MCDTKKPILICYSKFVLIPRKSARSYSSISLALLRVINCKRMETPFNSSKLYKAAVLGDVAALEEMQNQNVDILAQVSPGGNTALHISAYHGRGDFVERLLQLINEAINRVLNNGFLTLQNKEKNSALHEAVRGGDHAQIVRELITADAALAGIRNRNGQTALHMAAEQGHVDVVRCILELASSCVEIKDKDGRTALHCAVENAQIHVVRDLVVARGSLINIPDKNGDTALDIAIQYNEKPLSPYFRILRLLQEKNAIGGVKVVNKIRETSKPFASEERYNTTINGGFASEERYNTTINGLSVCAILIATVTYQAAFTLPRKHADPLAMSLLSAPLSTVLHRAFGDIAVFVICDTLAFCLSILTAIILAYANFLCRHQSWAVSVSAIILPCALYMGMLSFSLAILIQLSQDHYAVAAIINYAMVIMALVIFVVTPLVVFNALGCPNPFTISFRIPSGVHTCSADE